MPRQFDDDAFTDADRITVEGLERLNREVRVPDPEMSVIAAKAAMFDELVETLEQCLMHVPRGPYSLRVDVIEVLNRARAIGEKT